jgi:importin subunit beta-1
LFANCAQDDILGPDNSVFSFVHQHITSHDWHFKEAAVMAFASVLDGPQQALLEPYVKHMLPILTHLLNDQSIVVRDTSAWAIGRLCEILHECLSENEVQGLLSSLRNSLKDCPRVASHCAYVTILS